MGASETDIHSEHRPREHEKPTVDALSSVVDGTIYYLNVIKDLDARLQSLQGEIAIQKNKVEELTAENEKLKEENVRLKTQLESSVPVLGFESIEGNDDISPRRSNGTDDLDWEYFAGMLSTNAMSELNNRMIMSCLQALYRHNIIDNKFKLKNKYTSNVACHIIKQIRSHIATETKWSIYEKLFNRKNLRTCEKRPISPRERSVCRQIDQIIQKVYMSVEE